MPSEGPDIEVVLLTRQEVERRYSMSCATIYRLMDAGLFPKPVRVGVRAVRWHVRDVEQWERTRRRT